MHLAKLTSHRVINRWNTLDRETVSSSRPKYIQEQVEQDQRYHSLTHTRMGYFMD